MGERTRSPAIVTPERNSHTKLPVTGGEIAFFLDVLAFSQLHMFPRKDHLQINLGETPLVVLYLLTHWLDTHLLY